MHKLVLLHVFLLCAQVFGQTSANIVAEVDSILHSYCSPDTPGLAIGIVKDGRVIYKNALGTADLSNNIPLTDSTAFNIASVSKQFTALVALMAVEEGKMAWGDDIKVHLPELDRLPGKITVEQLANHTHGLPNYTDLMRLMGFGLDHPFTNAQAIKTILNTRQVNFEAGREFQYGNTGFMLLAEILKRLYQKPFALLVQEKIFEPLEMHQTAVIEDPNTIVANTSLAYRRSGGSYVEFPNRQMESGSSNIYTTLNDLVKWAENFQQPKIGNLPMYEQMTGPTVLKDGKVELYGKGLYTGSYKGLKTVFHGGGTAGYRAYILHVPAHEFSIVTLGNQESFDGLLIVYDVLELFFKDVLEEPVPSKTEYNAEELEGFAGTYQFQPGNFWSIRADGSNLYFGSDNEPLPLLGDGVFEFIYLPTATLTFLPNAMEFRVGDFTYLCKKVTLDPPAPDSESLNRYVGIYRNREFNIFYEILKREDGLVAKHLTNGEIALNPLAEHSFYGEYPLGQLDFELDSNNKATGFVLSSQNLSNIKFEKLH